MRVLIIANGESSPRQNLPAVDLVIAADGGAARALELGVAPKVVIGDLDSLPEETRQRLEREGCEFIVHPRAKDATDLELAIDEAQRRGATQITVIGALGARPDQTLANFLFPIKLSSAIEIEYLGDGWQAFLVRNQLAMTGKEGDLVSILPITAEARGISTKGLLYPLEKATLHRGSTRGISNEMLGNQAEVQVQDGILWVIHLEKDRFRE
ncbi:MAG: thiamine diphosphokinase [Chloroflexi bacterium]|nr:thiamine diphosphokinase [Chloroflexota bacterium]